MTKPTNLFEPYQLGAITLPNRAVIVEPLGNPWGLSFYVADDLEGNRWRFAGGRPTMG